MAAPLIEQQARIARINGNVQLMREGLFMPAQVGQLLLPGDRLLTADNARVMVLFTGVQNAMVVEQGAATTFNLQVFGNDQVPQWVATDILGQGVFFENQAPVAMNAEAETGMSGLFGNEASKPTSGSPSGQFSSESTGYPVLESIAGLAATAAIFSDTENGNANNPALTSGFAENGSASTTNPASPPAAGTGSEPGSNMDMGGTPNTETPPGDMTPTPSTANPVLALLEPVLSLLSLDTPTSVGSLPQLNQGLPVDGVSNLNLVG